MKKPLLITVIIVAPVCLLIAIYLQVSHHLISRGVNYLRTIRICQERYDQKDFGKLLNDKLGDYIKLSRTNGISPCNDEEELVSLVLAGGLKKVVES